MPVALAADISSGPLKRAGVSAGAGVSATSGPAREGGRQPFSLLFRGPTEHRLEQATYPLEHPQLGTVEIFMVPVGVSGSGLEYEAVFG